MANLVPKLDSTTLVTRAMRLPGIKINRGDFLYKQFRNRYPYETVRRAIEMNPAAAGISREEIDRFARESIKYEAAKVSALSFAAGVPGGIAMAGTVPADIAQYFGFILRITQKLAYLYGFSEFRLQEDEIDDATLNEIMVFLGVMFGVNEANVAVVKLAESVVQNIIMQIPQKAIAKGFVYPVVEVIAKKLGYTMSKELFAKGLSKVVPVMGGVANGGMTYVSFRTCANRLKKKFTELPISDPAYYSSFYDENA